MSKLITGSDSSKQLDIDILSECRYCGVPLAFSGINLPYQESKGVMLITLSCTRCKGRSPIRLTLNDPALVLRGNKNAK